MALPRTPFSWRTQPEPSWLPAVSLHLQTITASSKTLESQTLNLTPGAASSARVGGMFITMLSMTVVPLCHKPVDTELLNMPRMLLCSPALLMASPHETSPTLPSSTILWHRGITNTSYGTRPTFVHRRSERSLSSRAEEFHIYPPWSMGDYNITGRVSKHWQMGQNVELILEACWN